MIQWGSRAPVEPKPSAFRQHFMGVEVEEAAYALSYYLFPWLRVFCLPPRFVGQGGS